MSGLKKIEESLEKAPSIKAMLQIDLVQERFIANYEATTGKKDGKARFQSEAFAYMEIINDKPQLQKAPKFSHFAAIVKAGTTGLSFRDNKLYVQPGPNNTIKVTSSPAGKREMLENMSDIKQVPEPQIVMKGDLFVYDKLNGIVVEHKSTEKTINEIKLQNIVASYQRIYWKDGTIKDVVVYHDDLVKAKSKSPAKSDQSFWEQWPGEACKKVSTNRAFRLYHKYPDNIMTFGVDDDKAEESVVESAHEEVNDHGVSNQEPVDRTEPIAEEVVAEEVTEPVKQQKPKGKSAMGAFLDENLS